MKKEIMQKNAFRKIWTLLSHRVLRGIRAYDYNRVPKAPFCVCNSDTLKDHNQKKKEWQCAIG